MAEATGVRHVRYGEIGGRLHQEVPGPVETPQPDELPDREPVVGPEAAVEVVAEAIRDLTGGRGCDTYIEASGSPRSIETGFEVVRKAGRKARWQRLQFPKR